VFVEFSVLKWLVRLRVKALLVCTTTYYYYYYIRLTAFFQDNLGKPAPQR